MGLKNQSFIMDSQTSAPTTADGELFYRSDTTSGYIDENGTQYKVRDAKEIQGKAVTVAAAKGDLMVYNGTAWIILTAGTNGLQLQADSAEASGLKWASATAQETKSGIITKANFDADIIGIKSYTVVFSTNMTTLNYSVALSVVTDGDAHSFSPNIVAAPTVTGFEVSLGSANSTNLVSVGWITTLHGEF